MTKITEYIPESVHEEHENRKVLRKQKYKEIKEKCRKEIEDLIK